MTELGATAMWAGAGALLALSILAGFSFGMLVLPLAVVAIVWLASRHAKGRAPLGAGLGLALLPATVALIHADYSPCPASRADMADGNWSCGGTDPLPFAIITLVMVVGFLAAWRLTRD